MSIYSLIGILRCPFRKECGPDAGWGLDYEHEEKPLEKLCFTRRHLGCEVYKSKRLERMNRGSSRRVTPL